MPRVAAPATAANDMWLGRSSRPSGSSTGSVENTSIWAASKPSALSARRAAPTDGASLNSAVRNMLVFPDSDDRKQLAENQIEHHHGGEGGCRDRNLDPGRRVKTGGGGQVRTGQGGQDDEEALYPHP